MSDAKQATPAAELERQICSATEPKNEREWWAHHEIARLQESSRLRAELLAAARAELEALRAELVKWQDIAAAHYRNASIFATKAGNWYPPDEVIDEARKGAA